MSFGRQPISQAFLANDRHVEECFYHLAPAVCGDCGLFQLMETPRQEQIFHENYPFRTGTSRYMAAHFQRWAEQLIMEHGLDRCDLVVELGSNDGTMLSQFARRGVQHLGVEPARGVADEARSLGLHVLDGFFCEEVARRIRRKHGPARLIVAANVMAHIPDLHELGAGICHLLADEGVLCFEVLYLVDVLESAAFDQLYDEHVFTWSVSSVARVFGRFGIEVIHVEHLPVHGGSMRFVLAPAGSRPRSPAVPQALEEERARGLADPATYVNFRSRCEQKRIALCELLRALRAEGKRVVGYGATAKSATLLNYCGLDRSFIECIVDSTPAKQGRFTPGTHIPIRDLLHFTEFPPDYALLLAWNHRVEIEQRERWFLERGGRWVLYVPTVAIA